MKPKILFVHTYYPGFLEDFYKNRKLATKKGVFDEWFGSANFYSKSLSKCGWSCEEVIANDYNTQSLWAKEHNISVKNDSAWWVKKVPVVIKKYLGLDSWIKQILFAQIKTLKPDVVYIHDLWILNGNDLKRIKKSVKLIVGQIASPIPPNIMALKQYDLLTSSFPHYVEKFRAMGIKSEYLRWCVEASIAEKIGIKKRTYDVVYVGGITHLHSTGNKTLEKITREVKIDFWGYGYNLPKNSCILKNYHGHAWGRRMYEIFAQAKIVVNRHIDVAENFANNMRMFEATGMGALLLTEDRPNMSEFFQVGKEMTTYKNTNDLIAKIKYYLKHESEREKIAKAGQLRTLRDHTYQVRMRELDKILKKYVKV